MRTPSAIARRFLAAPLDVAAWAVLAVLAVVALLTFDDYGLAWDDYSHARYGEFLLAYYTSGFTDLRVSRFTIFIIRRRLRPGRGAARKLTPFDCS